MEDFHKARLRMALSARLGAAAGLANGIALSIGIWCTAASVWLLFH